MKYATKYYKKCFKTQKKWERSYLYSKFTDMKRRCYDVKHKSYNHYGNRGIKIEACLLNFKTYVDHLIDILPEGKTIEDMQKDKWTIDRINNDADYVRGNLRWASPTQQNLNRRKQKNNTSGFQGVYWHKRLKKWLAQICTNKKNIYLGLYDTPEKAFVAYLDAVYKYWGKKEYYHILSLHPHWEAK